MKNLKKSLLKVTLCSALTALLVLHSGSAIAQDLESRYEQSLLDSLINFEMLKPRFYTLTEVNKHLNAENIELRMQQRLLSLEKEYEKQMFAEQMEKEKLKVKRIRRRLIGVVIIGIIGTAAGR